jgi:hypothetical protein
MHHAVAAVDRGLREPSRCEIRVELALQGARGDHVGGERRSTHRPRDVDPLALRLRDTALVVFERRQLLCRDLDVDRRVVLEEVHDVVVPVERARRVLRVDGHTRIAGDHELEAGPGREIGQHGRIVVPIAVVPIRRPRARQAVGALDRERQRELRVRVADEFLAEIDLERAQGEQDAQRLLATAVDRGVPHRIRVDPREEPLRQRDAPLVAGGERAHAPGLDVRGDRPRVEGLGRGLGGCRAQQKDQREGRTRSASDHGHGEGFRSPVRSRGARSRPTRRGR